jgi:hypothetical protein
MMPEPEKQTADVAHALQRLGQMAVEMRNDARRAQLPMLDYLIGMVELEVQNARERLPRRAPEGADPQKLG